MNPETLGDDRLLSVLKDPFLAENMQSMNFGVIKMGGAFYASASVHFHNGMTSGQQAFTGPDLINVIVQVRDFLEELKRKQ